MEYLLEFLSDKKIVLMKMNGRVNFKTAEEYSVSALKMAKENNCSKFLFDHSNTKTSKGVNKFYASGSELEQFGFSSTDRVAVLLKSSEETIMDNSVINNSRWSEVKYFSASDKKSAIEWLNS